jgi:hypothetical protein
MGPSNSSHPVLVMQPGGWPGLVYRLGTSASFSEQNLGIQLQRMAVTQVMLVTLLLMGGYRHVPGMIEPVFVGLADLQSLLHIDKVT